MIKYMPKFKKRPLVIFLLITFSLLLVAELILRVLNPGILDFAYNLRQVYKYHCNWYTDFKPGTSTVVKLKDSTGGYYLNFMITVNEYAFRTHDRNLDYDLAADNKIIHAIGDSFTMGWGVNYESSYPAFLEFDLPEEYRVLNLGLNGYGTIGATEKSMEISKLFFPDAVVYLAIENDYQDDEKAVKHSEKHFLVHKMYDILNVLRQNTYIASTPFAVFWWLYYRKSLDADKDSKVGSKVSAKSNDNKIAIKEYEGPSDPSIGKESKSALLEYKDYLEERDVPFIVVSYGEGEVAKDIYAFCRENNISSYLISVPESYILINEGHFNRIGNYMISKLVHIILEENGII